jgi:mRNA-degrading endonuclease HigB of HigAB toxin-antitoxin module
MNVIVRSVFYKDVEKFPDDKDKILEALFDLRELSSLSESKHLKKMTGTKNMFRFSKNKSYIRNSHGRQQR